MKKSRKSRSNSQPAPPPAVEARTPVWVWMAGAAAALVALLLAYGPALHGPFLFDDLYFPFLDPNQNSRPWWGWLQNLRPLLMLSFWVNFRLGGVETFGYHLGNVLIHFLNGGVVFLLVRWFLKKAGQERELDLLAAFAAAIFLFHPLQTEAVSYVVSRSEGMSILFGYGAYAWFLYRCQENGASWKDAIVTASLFGLAVMSKEHVAVLPAAFVATDLFWRANGAGWGERLAALRQNWRLYVPMALAGGAGLVYIFRMLAASPTAGFGAAGIAWYEYLLTQCRAIWVYAGLYVLPIGQNADWDFPVRHGFDPLALLGGAALAAAGIAAFRFRDRYPLASFGFLLFLLLLAPTSSVIPIEDALAERRVYLPMIGLLLITIEAVRRLPATRAAKAAGMAVVVAALLVATAHRNEVWGNDVAMWEDVAAKSPANTRAHWQLGYAYYQSGRCADAAAQYEKAARTAPDDETLYLNWALALECLNQDDQALAKLERAAALKPTAHVYSQIGMIYGKRGQTEQARAALEKALQINPGFDSTYVYLGHLAAAANDLPEAAAQYRKALSLNPRNQDAQQSLAVVKQRMRSGS